MLGSENDDDDGCDDYYVTGQVIAEHDTCSSFPHLFPLLCGVDVSYETPPFSPVLRVLP